MKPRASTFSAYRQPYQQEPQWDQSLYLSPKQKFKADMMSMMWGSICNRKSSSQEVGQEQMELDFNWLKEKVSNYIEELYNGDVPFQK